MNEIIKTKMNILKEMDNYIRLIGDEDLWFDWIDNFPDECQDDELLEIAKDDNDWRTIIKDFSNLINEYLYFYTK